MGLFANCSHSHAEERERHLTEQQMIRAGLDPYAAVTAHARTRDQAERDGRALHAALDRAIAVNGPPPKEIMDLLRPISDRYRAEREEDGLPYPPVTNWREEAAMRDGLVVQQSDGVQSMTVEERSRRAASTAALDDALEAADLAVFTAELRQHGVADAAGLAAKLAALARAKREELRQHQHSDLASNAYRDDDDGPEIPTTDWVAEAELKRSRRVPAF